MEGGNIYSNSQNQSDSTKFQKFSQKSFIPDNTFNNIKSPKNNLFNKKILLVKIK